MTKGQLLQDPFLNSLRKGRIPVSIYLDERYQTAGPDRVFRPVCRSASQHRNSDGL